MIPRACKRLAEVDFPIAEVSRHAAREKSIRHGHPSTLHLWWARRPLASSRAVLLGLLWPDPCDPLCPAAFKAAARAALPGIPHCNPGADDAALRRALLRFIADFANWDLAAHPDYLRAARALVAAAHGGEAPLAVDPFAGGGSIPLEALRLGCEAFASDLNPVACLILKVMLEEIPRRGPALADELRAAGAEIRDRAAKELAEFYPADPDGATPIAYLWARTVRCEAPECGAEIPLMRSFWLCNKPNRKRALRYRIERPEGAPPRIAFEIFEPKAGEDPPAATVARARATCPCCNSVLSPQRVRAQLSERRGGADAIFDDDGRRVGGARMTAVVTIKPGETGRHYRLPTSADYAAVRRAHRRIGDILGEWERSSKPELSPVPDEPLPEERRQGNSGFRVLLYGVKNWGDLFTARQKMALIYLFKSIKKCAVLNKEQLLSCAFSRVAMSDMSCTRWNAIAEKMQHTFGRQAIPMVWDFAEVVITANAPGNWKSGYEIVADVIDTTCSTRNAQTALADATDHPLPHESAGIWFTDPPYYDAISFSDLSDFFLVWLKRLLPDHPLLRDPFDPGNPLSPKMREAVQDEARSYDGRIKDRVFFEEIMGGAFAEGRRVLRDDGVGAVVFAHKTTEGWEALLSGMILGGWTITGSWPISTEMGSRLNARDTASLATSVHLICRPRPEDAPIGDWADVLRELPERVGGWMARLQGEGVRGADLVFACIGPALEIFSRRRAVETADGREVGLGEYLEKVWEVVGRAALRQVLGAAEARAGNGGAGALEEDARLTALFLWTRQSTGAAGGNGADDDEESTARAAAKGLTLPFDVVRRFAQPMGIDLDRWTGRVIGQSKGVVRLLPVAERARELFGDSGAAAAAGWIETDPEGGLQRSLFPESDPAPRPRRGGKALRGDGGVEPPDRDATALDRVHAAMLLQSGGHSNALRALVAAEQARGPDFLRLANALSALYPRGGAEKRLIDAMLLAAPRRT